MAKKNEKERMQPGNMTAVKGPEKTLWLAKHLQPYYQAIYTCDSYRCVFVFALGYKIHFPSPAPGDFEGSIHMTLAYSSCGGPRNSKFCKSGTPGQVWWCKFNISPQ